MVRALCRSLGFLVFVFTVMVWGLPTQAVSQTVLQTGSESGLQTGPANTCDRPLTVRISDTYLPFSFKGEDGKAHGLDVTFIKQIFASLNCEYRFVFLPWKRALLGIENGDLDILPSASFTPEREKFARFSHPYRNEVSGMVIRKQDKGRFPLRGVEDIFLYGMKLGYVRGAYRGALFEAFQNMPGASRQLTEIGKSEIGFNLLLNRRIDGLVGLPVVSMAQAKKAGFADQLDIHPFLFGADPIHLMFSRKSVEPELVRHFNRAIAKAVQTESYRDLYSADAINPVPDNTSE